MEQLVEITVEQSLLTDSIIKYSAEKITKSNNNISLNGNAKLVYGKNNEGIIETGEIIIHVKQ